MAKEALGLYPNTTYVPYLKDQITQARGGLLTQAVQANKPTEAFSIGEEILNENPENLDLLIFLSRYALQTAKASKDYAAYSDKGTGYAKKAIVLLSTDKVKYDEAKWNNTSKPVMVASLHQ